MKHGTNYISTARCEFAVWAPFLSKVAVKIISPGEKLVPMEKDKEGYWRTTIEGVTSATKYFYRLNNEKDRPDPASQYQPQGVHGASQVVDHSAFVWSDVNWQGIPLNEMIMYELHVGTFTPDGTFHAIIPRLDELRDTGINTLELMPVSQFPGERNWGYDGVYPYAVQNSYGGPEGLKHLVNECHRKEIAVILDVVYNHLGPEGNYLRDFGPYFTNTCHTPWGEAINFDSAYSREVRNYFIDNAIHWFSHYHVDALRIDAIHAIFDIGEKHFLSELSERVEAFSQKMGRKYDLIAESDLNDSRVVISRESGGYGIDGVWCDDFHHSLHTLLTGENRGYYLDFGKVSHMAKSTKEGFVYSGEYSEFRKKSHGNSSKDIPAKQMVVFSQNHDQIGNRMLGERLSALVSFEALKLAAGTVLLSPYIPLLFMGEEYGEDAPFLYFTNHSDPDLVEAVRQGRKREFAEFEWLGEPPDPQSTETFLKSKIHWKKRKQGHYKVLLDFYKHLMRLRKTIPALSNLDKRNLFVEAIEGQRMLFVIRWKDSSQIMIVINFNYTDVTCIPPLSGEVWNKAIDSSEQIWSGPGSVLASELVPGTEITMRGRSIALYIRKSHVSVL
ncbi:MAG: malto-oligosyltrehalose trehalohydrolase [Candidatus Brocadia sp. WS118]|nr:MAG: malto-oligosyltrehalose trehalohydrolase [Candidatus Brocadia sp. WS118]